MEIQDGKVHLKIPLKVDRVDRILFREFLEDFANEYSYLNYRYMRVNPPQMRETKEGTLYEVALDYISPLYDEKASFLMSILAIPDENIDVIIQPIRDVETRKIERWKREHNNNIAELCSFLREEILRFTTSKGKVV